LESSPLGLLWPVLPEMAIVKVWIDNDLDENDIGGFEISEKQLEVPIFCSTVIYHMEISNG